MISRRGARLASPAHCRHPRSRIPRPQRNQRDEDCSPFPWSSFWPPVFFLQSLRSHAPGQGAKPVLGITRKKTSNAQESPTWASVSFSLTATNGRKRSFSTCCRPRQSDLLQPKPEAVLCLKASTKQNGGPKLLTISGRCFALRFVSPFFSLSSCAPVADSTIVDHSSLQLEKLLGFVQTWKSCLELRYVRLSHPSPVMCACRRIQSSLGTFPARQGLWTRSI